MRHPPQPAHALPYLVVYRRVLRLFHLVRPAVSGRTPGRGDGSPACAGRPAGRSEPALLSLAVAHVLHVGRIVRARVRDPAGALFGSLPDRHRTSDPRPNACRNGRRADDRRAVQTDPAHRGRDDGPSRRGVPCRGDSACPGVALRVDRRVDDAAGDRLPVVAAARDGCECTDRRGAAVVRRRRLPAVSHPRRSRAAAVLAAMAAEQSCG